MANQFEQACMSLMVTSCECPVCHRLLKPPVKMCFNGHCVCVRCVLNTSSCPTCKAGFSCTKIKVFEQVLNIFNCMCVHAKNGCHMFLDNAHKAEHEQFCGWRSILCLFCGWKGSLNKWAEHVVDQHGPHSLSYDTEGSKTIPLGRDIDKVLFYINGVLFCLYASQERGGPLFLAFQCFPTAKEDLHTIFSTSLDNGRLHFSQSIHPISDVVKRSDIFQDLDKCIIIPHYLTRGKDRYSFVLTLGDGL